MRVQWHQQTTHKFRSESSSRTFNWPRRAKTSKCSNMSRLGIRIEIKSNVHVVENNKKLWGVFTWRTRLLLCFAQDMPSPLTTMSNWAGLIPKITDVFIRTQNNGGVSPCTGRSKQVLLSPSRTIGTWVFRFPESSLNMSMWPSTARK